VDKARDCAKDFRFCRVISEEILRDGTSATRFVSGKVGSEWENENKSSSTNVNAVGRLESIYSQVPVLVKCFKTTEKNDLTGKGKNGHAGPSETSKRWVWLGLAEWSGPRLSKKCSLAHTVHEARPLE
jgi:hypothetical protein